MRSKRELLYLGLAVVYIACALGSAYAGNISTWAGSITKGAVTYYTFDEFNNPVANKVVIAKSRGVKTPNTFLVTIDSDTPPPLSVMDINSAVNGKLFLRTDGTLLANSRGASGHTSGFGVIVLDDTLTYNPATDTFKGSGRALVFDTAVNVSAAIGSRNGIESGAGKLTIMPNSASLQTITGGNIDSTDTTRILTKGMAVRFTKLAETPDTVDYSSYAGDWDYTYTMTAASDTANPDIGVPMNGTLSLNVAVNGLASFSIPNACGTVYDGDMKGLSMMLYSDNEESPVCDTSGTVVLTFTDANTASGNACTYDASGGGWTDGTITLNRVIP